MTGFEKQRRETGPAGTRKGSIEDRCPGTNGVVGSQGMSGVSGSIRVTEENGEWSF